MVSVSSFVPLMCPPNVLHYLPSFFSPLHLVPWPKYINMRQQLLCLVLFAIHGYGNLAAKIWNNWALSSGSFFVSGLKLKKGLVICVTDLVLLVSFVPELRNALLDVYLRHHNVHMWFGDSVLLVHLARAYSWFLFVDLGHSLYPWFLDLASLLLSSSVSRSMFVCAVFISLTILILFLSCMYFQAIIFRLRCHNWQYHLVIGVFIFPVFDFLSCWCFVVLHFPLVSLL